MAEYIDIDAPIDFRVYQGRSTTRAISSLRELFEKNDARWTAADVRTVVRGKWIRNARGNYNCSNCKSEHDAVFGFAFCPNCGADMREET